MNYSDICCYAPINGTDPDKVRKIADSIKENGWVGAPILVIEGQLITGSHRLAALKLLEEEDWDFIADALGDIAESVDDIVGNWCKANDRYVDDQFPFDSLRDVFCGTWVEEYATDIEEW